MNEADRELTIFSAALALPISERAAYLEGACVDSPELKHRLANLLKADERAATFFEELECETRSFRARIIEGPGKWIDRYLLLEQIGEGGCGVVYRAEQEKPVQRQVALKIIKLGMDTQQVVARFEAERQALALMDHPNIARVLDAGATDTGRPYFVMELVHGTKITDYCDQHQLSIAERLDLFIHVCRAIQHAHQKGVIHRDIKPSNILVSVHDGTAFPKIIDFGIAKATQGRLSNRTVFTAVEQFIGTPAYMSPEQAERGGLDIDTRSDIYSLGVLLYELLTSTPPFDSKELIDLGLEGMLQTIREKEPPRPSARLGSLPPNDLASLASRRHIDPVKLIAAVRGDLDWIVIKAIEKERSRRYETVNALIRDIERHLASEPVAARPPSRVDRFRKIVRRNKLAFAAGTAVLTALVLGFGVSTWLFLREREARSVAQAAMDKQERLRIKAEQEAIKNRELAQSLQDLLQRYGTGLTRNRVELKRMVDQIAADRTAGPMNAAHLRICAYIRGCIGQFSEADADLQRLIELAPEDGEIWHWRAVILLQSREYNAYREHCRRALERFKDTQNPYTAERIAKDSLLLPGVNPDMTVVEKMVDTALNAKAPGGWSHLAKAMSEYRKGDYASALAWLRLVPPGQDPYLDAETSLVMAIASQRANQPAEAMAALNNATKLITNKLPPLTDGEAAPNWIDRIVTDVLQREAQEVVGGAEGGQ